VILSRFIHLISDISNRQAVWSGIQAPMTGTIPYAFFINSLTTVRDYRFRVNQIGISEL
jgi:hypothetical protein